MYIFVQDRRSSCSYKLQSSGTGRPSRFCLCCGAIVPGRVSSDNHFSPQPRFEQDKQCGLATVIIIPVIFVLVVCGVGVGVYFCMHKRRQRHRDEEAEEFAAVHGTEYGAIMPQTTAVYVPQTTTAPQTMAVYAPPQTVTLPVAQTTTTETTTVYKPVVQATVTQAAPCAAQGRGTTLQHQTLGACGTQTASAPMGVGAEPDPEIFPTAPPCEETNGNFFV